MALGGEIHTTDSNFLQITGAVYSTFMSVMKHFVCNNKPIKIMIKGYGKIHWQCQRGVPEDPENTQTSESEIFAPTISIRVPPNSVPLDGMAEVANGTPKVLQSSPK